MLMPKGVEHLRSSSGSEVPSSLLLAPCSQLAPQVFLHQRKRSKNYFYTLFGASHARRSEVENLESCIRNELSLPFYLKVPDSVGQMDNARMYGMLLSRFVVGIGTAINAASRSYVSKATFQDERTTHIV